MNVGEQPSFGQMLKDLRLESGLTQEALAERAGLSVRGIQDLERGVTRPLKDTAHRLIGALSLGGTTRTRFEQAAGPAPRRRTFGQVSPPAHAASGAAEAPRPGLPAQLTTLIGREAEMARIHELLLRPDGRLLTLTGPGGIGKTRLAIEAASRLQGDFADGVVFVGLAAIHDSTLVPAAIAQALGVREASGRTLTEALIAFLRRRRLLLLLDNFEHLAGAALPVRDLLAACPHLAIMITSRAALQVRGERVLPVPPLALPRTTGGPYIDALQDSPAVALFVERAGGVDPQFVLTEANAAEVATICRRLDGLPLAIELAAARSKYLSPQALLGRLVPSLPILTGGARDLPERQQTLRKTIAWSYDLLHEAAQQVFRQLAIFADGCTIDAAMQVCLLDPMGSPHDLLDHLDSLVAASLLYAVDQPDGEPRFTMLETIREYGWEMLAAHGELPALQQRHATHMLALAEQAEPQLTGPDVAAWLERLEWEHDNLRGAITWAIAAGEAAIALRIAGALWRFWYLRSHLTEGRRRLEAALNMPGAGEVPAGIRAKALFGDSVQAMEQADFTHAAGLLEECLALYRQVADQRGVAATLNVLGLVSRMSGDYSRAISLHEESLALARAAGNRAGIATNLSNLGVIARDTGAYAHAADLYAESLAVYRDLRDHWGIATSLSNLAEATWFQGRSANAAALYRESLPLHQQLGHKQGMAECLEGLAWVAKAGGRLETATRLLAAADTIRQTIGYAPPPADRARRERDLAGLREAMNHSAPSSTDVASTLFDQAWAAGRHLPLGQAIAEALAVADPAPVNDDVG